MTLEFCRADRMPFSNASQNEDPQRSLGLKRFSAPASLLRVGIGDAETSPRQTVAVVDDRSGKINHASILDKKLHSMGGEFFISGLAGGDFHCIRHARATAGFDINAQAFTLGIGLPDYFGNVLGGTLG